MAKCEAWTRLLLALLLAHGAVAEGGSAGGGNATAGGNATTTLLAALQEENVVVLPGAEAGAPVGAVGAAVMLGLLVLVMACMCCACTLIGVVQVLDEGFARPALAPCPGCGYAVPDLEAWRRSLFGEALLGLGMPWVSMLACLGLWQLGELFGVDVLRFAPLLFLPVVARAKAAERWHTRRLEELDRRAQSAGQERSLAELWETAVSKAEVTDALSDGMAVVLAAALDAEARGRFAAAWSAGPLAPVLRPLAALGPAGSLAALLAFATHVQGCLSCLAMALAKEDWRCRAMLADLAGMGGLAVRCDGLEEEHPDPGARQLLDPTGYTLLTPVPQAKDSMEEPLVDASLAPLFATACSSFQQDWHSPPRGQLSGFRHRRGAPSWEIARKRFGRAVGYSAVEARLRQRR